MQSSIYNDVYTLTDVIGSNDEGYKTVYKSAGQFPIKTIQWDYNHSQWTINGQVGDTNVTRFTNNRSESCPPSDGWSYLYDSGSSEPSDIAIANNSAIQQDNDTFNDTFNDTLNDTFIESDTSWPGNTSCPSAVVVENSEQLHSSQGLQLA